MRTSDSPAVNPAGGAGDPLSAGAGPGLQPASAQRRRVSRGEPAARPDDRGGSAARLALLRGPARRRSAQRRPVARGHSRAPACARPICRAPSLMTPTCASRLAKSGSTCQKDSDRWASPVSASASTTSAFSGLHQLFDEGRQARQFQAEGRQLRRRPAAQRRFRRRQCLRLQFRWRCPDRRRFEAGAVRYPGALSKSVVDPQPGGLGAGGGTAQQDFVRRALGRGRTANKITRPIWTGRPRRPLAGAQ